MQGSFDDGWIVQASCTVSILLIYIYIYNLNLAAKLQWASHLPGVKNRSDLSSAHHISLNVEHSNVKFKL